MAKKKIFEGEKIEKKEEKKKLIALRDFRIVHNQYDIVIKAGDDVSKKVPEMFWQNLRTEKIL